MTVLISLLLALQATPAVATPSGSTPLIRAIRACMDAAVTDLEPSGEAAPVIAEAARTSCESERGALENYARSRGATLEAADTIAGRVMRELDEQMRSNAVLQVTEIRAGRRRH